MAQLDITAFIPNACWITLDETSLQAHEGENLNVEIKQPLKSLLDNIPIGYRLD